MKVNKTIRYVIAFFLTAGVFAFIYGKGNTLVASSDETNGSINTQASLSDALILAKSPTAFPDQMDYKGFLCKKSNYSFSVTNVHPLAHYECEYRNPTEENKNKFGGIIKFLDGQILEVKNVPESNWPEWFSISPGYIYQLSTNIYATNLYSGGPHCCNSLLIIDSTKQSFVNRIISGSYNFNIQKIDDTIAIRTGNGDFEYFLGTYPERVVPPLFYMVDKTGFVKDYFISEKLLEEEKSKILSAEIEITTPKTDIKDRNQLCENYNDDKTICNYTSDQVRKIAAVTGLYLSNNRLKEAEDYFYSFANKTKANLRLFEQIKTNALYFNADYMNKNNVWLPLPTTEEEAKNYLIRRLEDEDIKCISWVAGQSSDGNYWEVEKHSLNQDNNICPGPSNVSSTLGIYRIDKKTGAIDVNKIQTGEWQTLERSN